jgi:hypothetical protein
MQIPRRGGEPVFVDATGRRHRLFVVLGASGGLVLLLVALALLVGFTGTGPGGLPGWPGSDGGRAQGAGAKPTTEQSSGPGERPVTSGSPRAAVTLTPLANGTTPSATVTTAPTPSATGHRTVPSHTPNGHPSKKP